MPIETQIKITRFIGHETWKFERKHKRCFRLFTLFLLKFSKALWCFRFDLTCCLTNWKLINVLPRVPSRFEAFALFSEHKLVERLFCQRSLEAKLKFRLGNNGNLFVMLSFCLKKKVFTSTNDLTRRGAYYTCDQS
jgi:hypothetical protein